MGPIVFSNPPKAQANEEKKCPSLHVFAALVVKAHKGFSRKKNKGKKSLTFLQVVYDSLALLIGANPGWGREKKHSSSFPPSKRPSSSDEEEGELPQSDSSARTGKTPFVRPPFFSKREKSRVVFPSLSYFLLGKPVHGFVNVRSSIFLCKRREKTLQIFICFRQSPPRVFVTSSERW